WIDGSEKEMGMSRFAPVSVRPEQRLRSASAPMGARSTGRDGVTAQQPIAQPLIIGIAVSCQIALLLIALVPQTTWANAGYPSGPIPGAITPVVAVLFYVIPTLTGLLCRRWQF